MGSTFGLCGPAYLSQSPNVSAEDLQNWFVERVEAPYGKSPFALYQRPGKKLFVNLPGETLVPALFTQNGRTFAAGLNLWEIFSNGTATNYGALSPVIAKTVWITANQNQLLISSGGSLYLFTLATNTLAPVNAAQFNGPMTAIDFSDGFFVALQDKSQVFYVSNLLDGTTWQDQPG